MWEEIAESVIYQIKIARKKGLDSFTFIKNITRNDKIEAI